eukprot:206698_1
MSGNSLRVDELRRMMEAFDASNYTKSFAYISEEFTGSFCKELDLNNSNNNNEEGDIASNEHFRFLLASTLITLLNDRFNSQRRLQNPANKVINHGFFKPFQRLIALYLVYNLYKHKAIGHHPFLPHFMQIIDHCPMEMDTEIETDKKDKPSMTELIFADDIDENKLSQRFGPLCDKIEAEFIVKLLFNRDIDVISKMSPIKFTKVYCDKLINNKLEKWPEFAQIHKIISSRHNKNFTYSPLKTLGLNPILRDYDLNLDLKLAPFAVDHQIISDLALNLEFNNYATFDPEIVRPKPPFMIPFGKQEMRWQFLGSSPQLIWDDATPNGQDNGNDKQSIQILIQTDLMKLSIQKELNEHQQLLVINEMKSNANFIPYTKLNLLCLHNPYIAMQMFTILKSHSNVLLNQYFNALSTLNVSDGETAQNSMNLMKQIAQKMKIPKKYIVQFISHCIKTCEDTKEPFHQTRLV